MRYEIDRKNRTVTAVIENCKDDAYKFLSKRCRGFVAFVGEDLAMPDTFTAKVVCHTEDTFDEETGKKIARKRAADKHNRALKRMLKRHAEYMYSDLEVIKDYFIQTMDR